MPSNNIADILSALGVPISRGKFLEIAEYPRPDTLECLCHFLDELRINHLTVKLKPEQFDRIPFPAIALCRDTTRVTGYFALIQEASSNQVRYLDTDQGEIKVSLERFRQIWDGTTIVLEIDEQSGEPGYKQHQMQDRYRNWAVVGTIGAFILLCLLAFISFINQEEWVLSTYLLPLWGGGIVSFLIIRKAWGINDTWAQKICALGREPTTASERGCDTLIRSGTIKLFGWLSLGELGLLYFMVQLLLYIAFPIAGGTYSYALLFLTMTVAALPMVFFSLGYQLVKQIRCTLCLVIQFMVLLQLALLYPMGRSVSLNWNTMTDHLLLLFGFLLFSLALWLPLKLLLEDALQRKEERKKLAGFRHNETLFYSYLRAYPPKVFTALPNDIVLGNPAAPITLVMYSNPFCEPCTDLYPVVFDLLDYFKEELRLLLRFLPGKKAGDDKVVAHLLQLGRSPNIREAIETWYASKDYELWAGQFPKADPPNEPGLLSGEEALKIHEQWAADEAIRHTPVFYINGYLLRAPYKLEDVGQYIRYVASTYE